MRCTTRGTPGSTATGSTTTTGAGVAYTTGSDIDNDHKEIHFNLGYIGLARSLGVEYGPEQQKLAPPDRPLPRLCRLLRPQDGRHSEGAQLRLPPLPLLLFFLSPLVQSQPL